MTLDLTNKLDLKENYACIAFSCINLSDSTRILCEVHASIYDNCDKKIAEFNTLVNNMDCIESSDYNLICDKVNCDESDIRQSPVQNHVMKELTGVLNQFCVDTLIIWDFSILDSKNLQKDIVESNLNCSRIIISLKFLLNEKIKYLSEDVPEIGICMKRWIKLLNINVSEVLGDLETTATAARKSEVILFSILQALSSNRKIDYKEWQSYLIENKERKEKAEKIDSEDIGYYELEAYINKKKIKKAINIAGGSKNKIEYVDKLTKAHFSEKEVKLLIPYYKTMRCKVLAKLGFQVSVKKIKNAEHPMTVISKEIAPPLLEEAKKLARQTYSEKQYKEKLKKLVKDEKQYKILQQCYETFNKTTANGTKKGAKIGLSTDNNKSENAREAEIRGLFTAQDVSANRLSKLGFHYEPDFFRFLSKENYIIAKEMHHIINPTTGKITIEPFYCDSTVTYILEYYDLPFLYRLYRKEINIMDALKEKKITFCLVEAVSQIVGINNGIPVKVYCVRQENVFWFSKTKYLKMENGNIRILMEWDSRNKEFHNKNAKKIVKMLVSRKKQKMTKINSKI